MVFDKSYMELEFGVDPNSTEAEGYLPGFDEGQRYMHEDGRKYGSDVITSNNQPSGKATQVGRITGDGLDDGLQKTE